MFVFTNSTIKQEYAKIFIKDICTYLQYFKTISAKISKHHEANPELDSCSPVESPSYNTYSSGSGWYLRWMESPPIKLSGCDWTLENLNLFNKS